MSTTLDKIPFDELAKMLRGNTSHCRMFLSACSMAKPKLATAIMAKTNFISILGPDNKIAFADAAVFLHEQQPDWQIAQQNGLQILQDRFDKRVIGKRVISQLQAIANQLDTHRNANFIGSLLRHHLHKSTHYMSRWIEAKNQLPKNP